MTDEQAKRDREDMRYLVARPEFRRFLFRVIQSAGIYQRTTNGSADRSLDYFEGRRNLGLDILDMAETGQPIAEMHPAGPLLSIIQALIEETQQPSTEKPNGRRNSSDRYADLRDDDGDD